MLGVSAGFMRAASELLDAAGLAVYPDKRAIDFPSSFFALKVSASLGLGFPGWQFMLRI